jgi:hypothetical protein
MLPPAVISQYLIRYLFCDWAMLNKEAAQAHGTDLLTCTLVLKNANLPQNTEGYNKLPS